jgi:transcription elongation factor/antiterminator RfaH
MTGWYVVNTLPHQELRAETNLRRQGYRAWLPSIERSRRHARRIDTVTAPLFPGYLFVELDLDRESWGSINGTFGVRRLIAQRERPAPVPPGFVAALRETLDKKGLVTVPQALRPGQNVRLIAGPFVDCIGKLLYLATRDRVALLLSILGQEVSTLVSRRIIAPVA